MTKVFFSFGIIVLALIVGQVLKYLYNRDFFKSKDNFNAFIDTTRKLAFFILNPIVMVNSYWIVNFQNVSILLLPVICILVLSTSGCLGLLFSKYRKHSNEERAAMFGCSTFSNLGAIGGLIAFSFLGEEGFSIAAMYFILESFYNYLFGYPIIKSIGEGTNDSISEKLKSLVRDPSIVIYVSAVFIGVALNLLGFKRPEFMTAYNNVMIPSVSFLLIFTIAFRMEFTKIKSYLPEGLFIIFVKFVFSPILAICTGYYFGLQHLENGLVMKTLIIMTMTPCGFNSIVVPTLYNVDKDLANSVWIFSMLMLILLIPLEYVFLVLK